MAETLVKSVPATATGLVLRPGLFPLGGGFGGVERWVVWLVAVFGASCWVLREQARLGLFARFRSGPGHQTAARWVVCGGGGVGVVVV